jgi:hypothetical protein
MRAPYSGNKSSRVRGSSGPVRCFRVPFKMSSLKTAELDDPTLPFGVNQMQLTHSPEFLPWLAFISREKKCRQQIREEWVLEALPLRLPSRLRSKNYE